MGGSGSGSGTSNAPGLMVLTTGLSRPFRQLERLARAIQVTFPVQFNCTKAKILGQTFSIEFDIGY